MTGTLDIVNQLILLNEYISNVRKLSITPNKKCKLHRVKPQSLNIIENANGVQVVKCSKNMFLGSTVYHILSKGQHQVFTLISRGTLY